VRLGIPSSLRRLLIKLARNLFAEGAFVRLAGWDFLTNLGEEFQLRGTPKCVVVGAAARDRLVPGGRDRPELPVLRRSHGRPGR
jgi:hypothetical protein